MESVILLQDLSNLGEKNMKRQGKKNAPRIRSKNLISSVPINIGFSDVSAQPFSFGGENV